MLDVEKYIFELEKNELDFNEDEILQSPKRKNISFIHLFSLFKIIVRSVIDYIQLMIKLRFSKNFSQKSHFVYTSQNFCYQIKLVYQKSRLN